jgi:hypothetical protein
MAKSYYLPSSDKDRAAWLKNFSAKFNGYATTLGFTAADATSVANDSAYFSYALDVAEIYKSELKERTSYKDILRDGPIGSPLGALPTVPVLPPPPTVVLAGVFPRISGIVRRMKAFPTYTDAIGKDCGIIGTETLSVAAVMKPTLNITKEGGNVIVKYIKSSATGIQLWSKRGAEADFTLLAVVTKTSYKDTRPNLVTGQAETRVYKAWYIKEDQLIGQISDEVTFVM